jgi:hypothetical protein
MSLKYVFEIFQKGGHALFFFSLSTVSRKRKQQSADEQQLPVPPAKQTRASAAKSSVTSVTPKPISRPKRGKRGEIIEEQGASDVAGPSG